MMPERINDSSNPPAVMLIGNRPNNFGTRRHRPGKNCIRIFHHQNHTGRTPTQRLRAEIRMTRRFVRQPKLGPTHRQTGHHFSFVIGNA